ncbi:serine hydrolase [Streptomyces sp. NPDC001941]|uniref:D-alanyl-D-alanine carboxypeptidase family protein n=1 Tax=Streptomyces sp. NPDC001941 TaxID=3154659 RepID=UPI00332AD73C
MTRGTGTTHGRIRRTTAAAMAGTVGTATLATVMLAGAAPATARPATAHATSTANSPGTTGTTGGDVLARPGTHAAAGGPALPATLSARAWIVADADSGEVLAAHDAHRPLPPASTLKMLFADAVLPALPATAAHKVSDAELAQVGAGSSLVGIVPGQTYTVADLWRGVFLASGNDAVHVLCGMNGGWAKTVTDMQAKAARLGAKDTKVVSPDGYDAPGQVSSAHDLAVFLRSGLKDAAFAGYTATATTQFPGAPATKGKPSKPFAVQNTNRMLAGTQGVPRYPGLLGGKNGYTTNAGNTLAVAARKGDRTLVVAVMNPQNGQRNEVYTEAASLLDWGFAASAAKAAPVGKLPPREGEASRDGAAGPDASRASATADAGTALWPLAVGGGVVLLAGAGTAVLLNRRRRVREPGTAS